MPEPTAKKVFSELFEKLGEPFTVEEQERFDAMSEHDRSVFALRRLLALAER